MATTKEGGVYLAADGETLIDANGNTIAVEEEGSDNNAAKLPAIKKLAEHIAGMGAAEVQALKAQDDRATAAAIYDARLAELTGE